MSMVVENADYRHFEEMLESIPGGGMCVVYDLDFTVVFINDVLLGMLGYSREQFSAETEGQFIRVIHPDDRQRAFAGAKRSIDDGAYSYSFRAMKRGGGLIWLRGSAKNTIAPDGRELLTCVFSDVSDEKRLREEFDTLIKNMPGAAAVFDISEEGSKLRYVSEGYCRLSGYSHEECKLLLNLDPCSLVHPDDYLQVKNAMAIVLENESSDAIAFRGRCKNGEYLWLTMSLSFIEEDGAKRLYILFTDVSPEKAAMEELAFTSKQLQTIVDSAAMLSMGDSFEQSVRMALEKIRNYFLGTRAYIFEFDWEKNTIKRTFGVSALGYETSMSKLDNKPIEEISFWFDALEGDDVVKLTTAELSESNAAEEKHFLQSQGVKELISVPLRADGRLMGFVGVDDPDINVDDASLLVILSYFISSELNKYRTKERMLRSEKRLRDLVLNAPGGLLHFRICNGEVIPKTISRSLAKTFGISEEETLEKLKKNLFVNVHPDDLEGLKQCVQRLIDGENRLTHTYRLLVSAKKKYVWMKVDALAVAGSDGNLDVYASYLDVSREVGMRRSIEQRFNTVSSQIKAANKNSLALNLTQNRIDMRSSVLVDGWGFPEDGTPQELFNLISDERAGLIHECERERAISTLSYDSLKKAYSEGADELTLEMRVLTNASWRWFRVSIHLVKDAKKGELIALIWAEDIHQEKLRQTIIERVTEADYDYISVIDVNKNSYELFAYDENGQALPPSKGSDYESVSHAYADTYVIPEDRARVKRTCNISSVIARLEEESYCSGTAHVLDAEGKPQVKCLRYMWLDKDEGLLLCTRTDITDAVLEEQQMREALGMLIMAAGQNKMSVWTYDLDTRMISFSEPSCDIHGLIGRGLLRPWDYVKEGFVHPEDADKYLNMLRRVHEGEAIVSEEIRYLDIPGNLDSCRWEKTIFALVKDKDGSVHKSYGTSQDISEQKLLRQRFEKEMERIRRIKMGADVPSYIAFNATKDIIIEHEPNGLPVLTLQPGSSMEEARRYTACAGVSSNDSRLFSDCVDRELILSTFRDGGDHIVREYRRPGKDGAVIWARSTVSIVQDPSCGDIVCFGYTQDITEERMREAVLDTMLSAEYEYVMYVDLKNDSFRTFANKYGGTLLPESSGKYSSMIHRYIKDSCVEEDVERTLALALPNGLRSQLRYADSFEFICRVREEDGSISIKKLRCGYIDKDNELVYCYRMDVSDLFEKEREQKEAISAALADAERANAAKLRFLTRMSRDMRTPMNTVLGLTKLTLERDDLSPELRENIKHMERSASSLYDLIDDVLDLTKIESGELSFHYERVDIRALFSELLEQIKALAEQEKVGFSWEAQDTVWGELLMDRLRVWQVFFKLLSTAVKTEKSGGNVRFSIEREGDSEDSVNYKFTLGDDGVRLGADLYASMFEPCEGDKRSISDDFEGAGMALPIVKNLIEQMGGSVSVISVISESSDKSEIVIRLSFRQAGEDDLSDTQPCDYDKLEGKRVLLVEDHPANQLVAKKLLESRKLIVDTAENGQIAVSTYTEAPEHHYDAILMDVGMPVMGGLEATRRIRSSDKPDAAQIPIIAMTANAFEEDVRASHDAGMNEHLSKPIEPQKLFDALCRCIK